MPTRAIIFLHGAGGSARTLLALEYWLRYVHGSCTNVLRLEYDNDAPSVDAVVASLAERVLATADELVLVGVSLGGVIGYRLACAHPSRVRMLVTIASPLHGASLVRWLRATMPSVYTLFMRRRFYDDLENAQRLPPPPVPYHCFTTGWATSTFDGCVFVDEARFDEERHTHFTFGDHRTIVVDPRLLAAVSACIAQEQDAVVCELHAPHKCK